MDNIITTDATVTELAEQMLAEFEQRTRNDDQSFWALKDGSADWMRQICHKAHGDMLPDDHRYRFIVDALSVLAEGDDDGETIEADCYTADLTGWINSRTDRYAYCDEALAEFGIDLGSGNVTITLLSVGQLMERQEVFRLVKDALAALVGEV